MDDPKYPGCALLVQLEEVKPAPPPKVLYYYSKVDGTKYNVVKGEDGKEYAVEIVDKPVATPQPAKPADVAAAKLKAAQVASDEKTADAFGMTQVNKK